MASSSLAFSLVSSGNSTNGRGRAVGYRPLNGVEWTVTTESEEMKKLIDERERVFAALRRLHNPQLEARHLDDLNQSVHANSNDSRCAFERYREFCTMVNIPVLPLTSTTIALFVAAKCSWKNGCYRSFSARLTQLKDVGNSIWSDEQPYREAERVVDGESAMHEFHKEREGVKTRKRRSLKGKGWDEVESDDSESDIDNDGTYENLTSMRRKHNSRYGFESEDSESDDGDDENCWKEDQIGGRAGELSSDARKMAQIAVPNLPRNGASFSSSKDFFAACYEALLPVYGTGVKHSKHGPALLPARCLIVCIRSHTRYNSRPGGRCLWRILATLDESTQKLVVNHAQSDLYHNHPPHPKILQNPDWRPVINNLDMREKLGIEESKPVKKKLKTIPSTQPQLLSQTPSSNESNVQPFALPYPSVSTSHFVKSNLQPFPPTSVHAQSTTSSLPTSLPTSLHAPTYYQPSLPNSPGFLPQMQSFLFALDPSLPPLGPILLEMGFDSLELVAQLSSFESYTLLQLSRAITAHLGGGGGGGGGGREHLTKMFELFRIKVFEAREKGFQ